MTKAKSTQKGFTVLELLIVIVVIGILAALVIVQFTNAKKKSYFSSAKYEMNTILKAAEYYNFYNGDYPADVNRDVPAELQQYISKNTNTGDWPNAPWPNSVYDYDRFVYDGVDTVQISVRFCPIGGQLSDCSFPDEAWAANFRVNSSAYYCLKGNCKSHPTYGPDYEGYCIAGCSSNRTGGTYYQPPGYPI